MQSIYATTSHKSKERTGKKHTTIKTRELWLGLYPHFYPFVDELEKRLIYESVRGLQSADTEYYGEGPQEVLPDSTLVKLDAGTSIVHRDGNEEILEYDIEVTVPDGTIGTLSDGTQITVPYGRPAIADDGPKIMFPAGTLVRLSDGRQIILLSKTNSIKAILLGCKPRPKLYEPIFPQAGYSTSDLVLHPYPIKDLDFTSNGAYSVYNWEIFYHVPLTIAIHLSKNQRFEEAQQWFHYIFDPTDNSEGPTPERFWKVKPFQYTDVKLIEEVLINLSTGADPKLYQETFDSIDQWKNAPFRPFLVARYRQSAFMFKTVMAYLDNLIAWGDALFRQDTGESINDATLLYILAASILGPRPQAVPKRGSVRAQTYHNIRGSLDAFRNALVNLETSIGFDLAPPPSESTDTERSCTIRSIGQTLYFCIPRNDNLLSYWDTVADRLFKIHNSLNLQGTFRQLPLFEPSIDPGLLAKAAASGLDVGTIISGINQPLPLVRFQLLVQKAVDICQEVKSLGNNILSAMEKGDNEAIAILRAKHETIILSMVETVKYQQWQEAIKSREGLEKSLINAAQRYTYYERLLGKDVKDIKIPELEALDRDSLEKVKFEDNLDKSSLEKMKFNSIEPPIDLPNIEIDIAQDQSGEGGGRKMSSHEVEELKKLKDARDLQNSAIDNEATAAERGYIPDISINVQPLGVGVSTSMGGSYLSKFPANSAREDRSDADKTSYDANKAAKIGSYSRREQEWRFQGNLAAGEITQIFKQIRAAQIREVIAENELLNHHQQIRHAKVIEQFLTDEKNGKIANQAFYAWMKREAKGLYGQCFQLAFDIAKKAERALQHELGNPDLSYIQFGYLAGKEGLFAGEKLYLDIRHMEMDYHEMNQREHEMTKHISLLQVAPLDLLMLRTTGRCMVSIPEELFDTDSPGHYFRRIKSVAISIPCVTGPYTSVNCKLTLRKSTIRKSPLLQENNYACQGPEDERFSTYFGSTQSIVTSTGQNDGGMFETNLRDERYLPFEMSGVITEWQLELPANPSNKDPCQFDYNTIADVIIHIRYTAREGGDLLRKGAIDNLKSRIDEAQTAGSIRLFSVRYEFPNEWAKFKITSKLTLNLKEEHYPFWSQGRCNALKQVEIFAKGGDESDIQVTQIQPDEESKMDILTKSDLYGGLRSGKLRNISVPAPIGMFTLHFNENSMEDILLAVTWGK